MGRSSFSGPLYSENGFITGGEWVDIDFPIIIRTTGTGIPSLTTLQGNVTAPSWAVNDFNVCEGQELIHGWKEGSTVYWHVHFITNGTNVDNRYVKWTVEWFWVNINGVLSDTITTTSPDILIPANTTSKTMLIGSVGSYALTDARIGGHVFARLSRVAASGTAPSNNPWCSMLQMHVEVDTLGSQQIFSKE